MHTSSSPHRSLLYTEAGCLVLYPLLIAFCCFGRGAASMGDVQHLLNAKDIEIRVLQSELMEVCTSLDVKGVHCIRAHIITNISQEHE